MNHFSRAALILLIGSAFLCVAHSLQAQTEKSGSSASIITKVRVDVGESFVGPLYVTIGGQEKKVAAEAIEAWIIQGGRQVVYSARDGAGGFENEGQSLRVYNAQTGRQRKILSEYVGVDKVTEATTSKGQTALLVEMSDGGLGASYFAVVDPSRGEVFYRSWARLLSRRGDAISLGFYKEEDWGSETEITKIKPYKTLTYNLNAILRGRVIYNKPDRP